MPGIITSSNTRSGLGKVRTISSARRPELAALTRYKGMSSSLRTVRFSGESSTMRMVGKMSQA